MANPLPLPPDSDLPPEVAARLAARPPINIYRLLANVPQIVIPFTDVIKANYQGSLSPRLREIAILRQGAGAKSKYEIHQHRLIALALGMTDAEIDAIIKFEPLDFLTETERLVCVMCDQIESTATLDDETYEKARAAFAPPQFVELIVVISFYCGLGRILNSTRIEIEKHNVLAGLSSPN